MSRRNACIFAGAGTGKTHGLITECLLLLGGADRAEALSPARLCLLTFTEKAGAEMRGRLTARVEALAAGRREEPELEAAFAATGQPFPGPAEWRRIQSRLSGATLATFHGYCAALLRRAPPEAGVPPDFEILDEEEAADLLEDEAERLVLSRLEADDAGVEALCTELDLHGAQGRTGLVDMLLDAFGRMRDHGFSVERLSLSTPAQVERALFESAEALRPCLTAALERARSEGAECTAVLAAMSDLLVGWGPSTALERAARLAELKEAIPSRGGKNGLGSALKSLRDFFASPASPLAAVSLALALPHEVAWRSLMVELQARQRRAFDEQGVLDFGELLVRARDLLASHLPFRAREQARIGALLLDEFQDTNRVQLELVHLLAEARTEAPRPLGPDGPCILPLQPDLLRAVGDRKQSIYDFRGADVEVFEQLARAVETQGGERRFLRTSRRAQPALITALNAVFAEVLGPTAERPWKVPFRAGEDDLLPFRPQIGSPFAIERLVAAVEPEARIEERRRAEADLLARRLAHLLAPSDVPENPGDAEDSASGVRSGAVHVPGADGKLRPVRGGEVAVLLRSFTEVGLYSDALARHRVPHRVLRGRGLYATPEVRDAAALLGHLADPWHPVHLAACLRGPWVGLSDATLVRLALPNGRLDPRVLAGGLPAEALPEEGERLSDFLSVTRRLRAEMDRLSLVDLLELAWEGLGIRSALAAGPHGEEQLANLERLRLLAARWDARGRSDAAGFAARLVLLAERDPRLGAEEVEDARAGQAVQILTVHAAKGLEWPVVCVADLGASRQGPSGRLLVDPRLGLAFRPAVPWSAETQATPRTAELAEVLASREEAESRRLLYVALTRARDQLILSGVPGRNGKSWSSWLDPVLGGASLAAHVLTSSEASYPPRPAPPVAEVPRVEVERALALLARLEAPPDCAVGEVTIAAEAVEDQRHCRRRFQLRHLEGHREGPGRAAGHVVSPRHRDARPGLVRALLSNLPANALVEGLPPGVVGPILGRMGLTVGEAEALDLLAPLRRLARALNGFAAGWLWEAGSPFQLSLGNVVLEGRHDLVFSNGREAAALALAFGPAPSSGYPVLTSALLEALGEGSLGGGELRAAVVPVDTTVERIQWSGKPPLTRAELTEAAHGALQLEEPLAPVLELPRCEALGCGFASRCHPGKRGL
jgi:ATP-dependent helicase/nuclease subunit A